MELISKACCLTLMLENIALKLYLILVKKINRISNKKNATKILYLLSKKKKFVTLMMKPWTTNRFEKHLSIVESNPSFF